MNPIQRNRVYSLIVGKDDDAVEINNLQMKFKVVKTSNNKDKKNSAQVEIYNLSAERRKKLEDDYIQVVLKVGYSDTDLVQLFSGQVTNISTSKLGSFLTKRQNTDLVTKLDIDEFYQEVNNTTLNRIVPAGKTLKDVFREIVSGVTGISRQEINGTAVQRQVIDGYPLSGTPRQCLDKLSRECEVEWQIDSGVLYVSDSDGTFTDDRSSVISIGQMSGLIERPEYINEEAKRLRREVKGKAPKNKKPKKNSMRLKILLNPVLIAGSIIHLDFEDLSGYYKVDEVSHEGDFRGNNWYSTLTITERV